MDNIKMMTKKQREKTVAYVIDLFKEGVEKYSKSNGRTKELDLLMGIIKSKPESIKINVTGIGCDDDASVYRVKFDITVPGDDFVEWLDNADKLCKELNV